MKMKIPQDPYLTNEEQEAYVTNMIGKGFTFIGSTGTITGASIGKSGMIDLVIDFKEKEPTLFDNPKKVSMSISSNE